MIACAKCGAVHSPRELCREWLLPLPERRYMLSRDSHRHLQVTNQYGASLRPHGDQFYVLLRLDDVESAWRAHELEWRRAWAQRLQEIDHLRATARADEATMAGALREAEAELDGIRLHLLQVLAEILTPVLRKPWRELL